MADINTACRHASWSAYQRALPCMLHGVSCRNTSLIPCLAATLLWRGVHTRTVQNPAWRLLIWTTCGKAFQSNTLCMYVSYIHSNSHFIGSIDTCFVDDNIYNCKQPLIIQGLQLSCYISLCDLKWIICVFAEIFGIHFIKCAINCNVAWCAQLDLS